ncbi:MAG: hypothetical protein Q4F85_11950 [Prevotella sp.]|nr:hypothetical protein [Prevotella sp.]
MQGHGGGHGQHVGSEGYEHRDACRHCRPAAAERQSGRGGGGDAGTEFHLLERLRGVQPACCEVAQHKVGFSFICCHGSLFV